MELSELDKSESKKEEDIRHATDIIGEWGPYQRNVLIIITALYCIAPFQSLGVVFYTPKLDFWCKRPPGFENATRQTCQSYEDPSKPCLEYEYDLNGHRSTIVDSFDLVCERTWLISMTKSVYQIGYLVSSIAFGIISDQYGRLTAKKLAVVMEIAAGLSQAFSQSITQFILARFFLGVAAWARFLTGALIIIEIVGPNYRASMRLVNEFGWSTGKMLLPCVMYFVRHFRYMQLAITVYEMCFLYALWTYIPESPRWQLTHGRFAEAEKTIIRAAKVNGTFSEDEVKQKLVKLKEFVELEEQQLKAEAGKNIFDLWKVPSLRNLSIVQYFMWFIMAFNAYGFTFNAGDIGGSSYVTLLLQGAGQGTALVVILCIVDKIGRRPIGIITVWANGLCMFAMIPFLLGGEKYNVYLMIAVFVGQVFSSGGWQVAYFFATELFPTTLRQIGVGSCSVSGRIGSSVAPFIAQLTEATHVSVTITLFGVLAFFQGGLIFFLPETKDKEIPDTIEEAEEFNRKKNAAQSSN